MSQQMQPAAPDIAAAILQINEGALMSGDVEAFATVFHVPQVMATMAGPIDMETVDEMHQHFKAVGVTEMIRTCVAAQYDTPTRIQSTHVRDLLHNGKRLNEPYRVFSGLERINGDCKLTSDEYALEPSNGQALVSRRADTSQHPQST